jgi:hypothetical protein
MTTLYAMNISQMTMIPCDGLLLTLSTLCHGMSDDWHGPKPLALCGWYG